MCIGIYCYPFIIYQAEQTLLSHKIKIVQNEKKNTRSPISHKFHIKDFIVYCPLCKYHAEVEYNAIIYFCNFTPFGCKLHFYCSKVLLFESHTISIHICCGIILVLYGRYFYRKIHDQVDGFFSSSS